MRRFLAFSLVLLGLCLSTTLVQAQRTQTIGNSFLTGNEHVCQPVFHGLRSGQVIDANSRAATFQVEMGKVGLLRGDFYVNGELVPTGYLTTVAGLRVHSHNVASLEFYADASMSGAYELTYRITENGEGNCGKGDQATIDFKIKNGVDVPMPHGFAPEMACTPVFANGASGTTVYCSTAPPLTMPDFGILGIGNATGEYTVNGVPVAAMTGTQTVGGMTFNSPNAATFDLDVSASMPGVYTLTFTVAGPPPLGAPTTCDGGESVTVSVVIDGAPNPMFDAPMPVVCDDVNARNFNVMTSMGPMNGDETFSVSTYTLTMGSTVSNGLTGEDFAGNPTFTYTGFGTSVSTGTQLFTIEETNACGTGSNTGTVTFIQDPEPEIRVAGTATTAETVCSGDDLTYRVVNTLDPTADRALYDFQVQTVMNTGGITGTNIPSVGDISLHSDQIMLMGLTNPGTAPADLTIVYQTRRQIPGSSPAIYCNSRAEITITVNPDPTVDPITFQELCNGGMTLAVTFTGDVAGTTFNWTNDDTSIGLAASGTGDIAAFTATNATASTVTATITVTPSANGCTGTPEMFDITVNPTPTPSITVTETSGTTDDDGVLCMGDMANLDAGTFTSYLWSTAETTQDIDVSAAGTYTVTVTDANGCTNTASSTITVNPLPTATAGNGGPICAGDDLTLTAMSATATSWSWSGPNAFTSTLQNPTVSAATTAASGTYTVIATDVNGCTATASTTAVVNPLPFSAITAVETSGTTDDDGIICAGDAVTLNVVPSTGPPPVAPVVPRISGLSLVPVNSPFGSGQFISVENIASPRPVNGTPSVSPTYNLVVSDQSGGSSTTIVQSFTFDEDEIIFSNFVPSAPGIPLRSSNPFLPTFFNFTLSETSGWMAITDDSGNALDLVIWGSSYSPPQTLFSFSGGSMSTITVANLFTGSPVPDCGGDLFRGDFDNTPASAADWECVTLGNFSDATASRSAALTYLWSNGETTPSITEMPASTTVYTVTVTDMNGCTATASTTVTVNPLPTPSINVTETSGTANDARVCAGDDATLTASGGTTYAWSDAASTTTAALNVTPAATTTYTVTVTDVNGCQATATQTITVDPLPSVADITKTVCSDEELDINLPADLVFDVSITNIDGLAFSGMTGGGNATNQDNDFLLDDSWTNTTGTPSTITYTLTPKDDSNPPGCVGMMFTVTITVNPEPVVADATHTACSDQELMYTLPNDSGLATAFEVSAISTIPAGLTAFAGNATVGDTGNDMLISGDGYENLTTGALDVTYTIIPSSAAGCAGDPFDVVVTINPEPVVDGDTDDLCSGETIDYDLEDIVDAPSSVAVSNTDGFNLIAVNFDNTLLTAGAGNASVGNGLANDAIEDDVYTNISNASQDVTYQVAAVSADGCVSDTVDVVITIDPEPNGMSTVINVCSGEDFTVAFNDYITNLGAFTPNFLGTVGYAYVAGPSPFFPGIGNLSPTPPLPIVPVIGTDIEITGNYQNFSLAPIDIVYTITPQAPPLFGCVGEPFTITIRVNPNPFGSMDINGDTDLCNGESRNVEANPFSFVMPAGFTYAWSSAITGGTVADAGTFDDATLKSPIYTAPTTGNGTVDVTVVATHTGSGCDVTFTQSFTINDAPTATPTELEVCAAPGSSQAMFDLSLADAAVIGSSAGTVTYHSSFSDAVAGLGMLPGTLNTSSTVVYARLTNPGGCWSVADVTLTVNEAPQLSAMVTDVACNGDMTGTIDLTVMPTGTYDYNWTATLPATIDALASSMQDPTGLGAGTYTVVVTNTTTMCTNSIAVTVNEPTDLMVTTASSNPSCNGATDGVVSATGAGGVGGYTYVWYSSNPDPTPVLADVVSGTGIATGLVAGQYWVVVTDNNGCTEVGTETLTAPATISATLTVDNNVSCADGSNGQVTLSAITGGTAPYTVTWSNGAAATATVVSNLTAGGVSATIIDANGCELIVSANITEPDPVTAVITAQKDAGCFAGNDGSATVTAAGGTENGGTNMTTEGYQYDWSGPNSYSSTAQTALDLTAGTYTVVVTDDNGCTASTSVIIGEPTGVTLELVSTTDETCHDASDGTATVNATGGTTDNGTIAGYTYQWTISNGTSTTLMNADQATATGLEAGVTYTVIAFDINGCQAAFSINVMIDEPAELMVTATGTNPLCNGEATGSVDASATGGTVVYNYEWFDADPSGTATSLGNSATLAGLAAGTYWVVATDDNGCTAVDDVMLTDPTALSGTLATTPADCAGGANGTATVAAAGGTGTLTYAWSNGAVDGMGNPTLTTIDNLPAGGVDVTITDGNGCELVLSGDVTDPSGVTAVISSQTDATCLGATDGTATVVADDGTPSYTYQWSDENGVDIDGTVNTSAITATLSGVAAGTYTVLVTDANGCTASTSVVIGEPTLMVADIINTTDVSCFNATDGTATASVTGGNPAMTGYTYQWYTGTTTANPIASADQVTLTGVAAGSYTVQVTSLAGCVSTATAVIGTPTAVTVTVSGTSPLCHDDATGTVTATGDGGVGGYSYVWNDGTANVGTTATVTGLQVVGTTTYTVTVTDNNGCMTTGSVDLTNPTEITGTLANNMSVTCHGDADGSIEVTNVAGGTAPLTYLWSTGATGTSVTGLPGGSVSVTITDANSCELILTDEIAEPQPLELVILQVVDLTCNGDASGSVRGIVSQTNPGTSPYVFSLTKDGQGIRRFPTTGTRADINFSFDNLAAGNYRVRVEDANGCRAHLDFDIDEPTAVLAEITSTTDETCHDAEDGTATVNATGGTTGYMYAWYAGTVDPANLMASQTAATATDLSNGTVYSVVVTDAAGCTDVTTATVGQPTPVSVTLNFAVDPSCAGGLNGAIYTTTSGGTGGPYSYNWTGTPFDPSNLSNQPIDDAQDVIGLPQGTYAVVVTDGNGCTAALTGITLTDPAAITGTLVTVAADCAGGADGEASVMNLMGGTLASGNVYSYVWSNGETTASGANLPAGDLSVTISDDNGCTLELNGNVTDPTGVTATITDQTDETCEPRDDATITVMGDQGVAPYTYLWSDGQTTATAIDLAAGTYTVTVTDANLCTAVTSATVNEPPVINMFVVSSSNVDCNGGTNGEIIVDATGGIPVYTYSIDPRPTTSTGSGPTAFGRNNQFTDLAAGIYTVRVRDTNGCGKQITVEITEPTVLSVAVDSQVDPTCTGNDDGNIQITADGGTTGYSYLWSNGSTDEDLVDVTASTAGTVYTVTVTDANGCTATASTTLTAPTAITASAMVTSDYNGAQISCAGAADGTAMASATGGDGNYSYEWSTGMTNTTGMVAGLAQGAYSVTVTDGNGCTDEVSITIAEPVQITATIIAQSDETCAELDNGTATVIASGGTLGTAGDYNYSWSNGDDTFIASGLAAGTYAVIVSDANGCSALATVTIDQPEALNIVVVSSTDVDCNGNATGSVVVDGTGGTAPYTFSLDGTAGASNTFTGLAAATYTMMVTDANGCTNTMDVVIDEPTAIAVMLDSSTDPTCTNADDGNIQITATGGTGGYSYLWSNGSTDEDLNDVTASMAGTVYTVTVTDANGCSTTTTTTLTAPAGVVASAMVTSDYNGVQIRCAGDTDGTAMASATGGDGTYTYAWSNGQTTAEATGLAQGSYDVTITDGNGCSDVASVSIVEPDLLTASITGSTDVTCNGGIDGTAVVAPLGGTAPFTYFWDNSETTQLATALDAGVHFVVITDVNGCAFTASVTINEPAELVANVSATTDANCGGADGTATAVAVGGTAPYSYAWTGGQTTALASGLAVGTYSVTITDANGCSDVATGTVNELPGITINASVVQDVQCPGGADAIVTADITGGVAPVTYAWSDGSTTQSVNGLGTGSYTVTASDVNGCTAEATVTVVEPAPFVLSLTTTEESCIDAADGTILIATVTGGTPGYTFNWSNDANVQDLVGVTAGTYTVTVTDANGCTITASETVTTVPDVTDPVITGAPSSFTLGTDLDECSTVVDWTIPAATDNCSVVSYAVTFTAGADAPANLPEDEDDVMSGDDLTTTFDVGQTVVTLTATDAAGNEAVETFTVTIDDVQAPMAVCADATVSIDANGNASITAAQLDGGSSDNCGIASVTASPTAFTGADLGAQSVTVTVTDVNGLTSTCTSTVTVQDLIAPVARCVGDFTVELDANGQYTLTTAEVDNGSTDNSGTVFLSLSQTTFDCGDAGTTIPVRLIATDASGNSSSCTVNVTVTVIDPITAICGSTVNLTLDGSGTATLTVAAISANAPCGIDKIRILRPALFTCADLGTTTVQVYIVEGTSPRFCSINVNLTDPTGACGSAIVSDDNNVIGTTAVNQTRVLEDTNGKVATATNAAHVLSAVTASPNPFDAMTSINYFLTEDSRVNVTVFDLNGKQLETIFEGNQLLGTQSLQWQPNSGIASGVYNVVISTDKERQFVRVIRK